VIAGTPRMLDRAGRAGTDAETEVKRHTADSFTYEWRHFGAPRPEWRKNFLDYMQPHEAEFFDDLLVLDVGAGSGRHSAQAAALGARVVAVDLGRSIDIARGNVPAGVLTVQADAERLPFERGTFDFVMSIGVLHHLPDPRRALASLVHYAAPGGRVRVYLYWRPERRWHRSVLALVTEARRVTVRLPHRLLHRLCYPLAAILWLGVVVPYRAMRERSRLAGVAAALPLKAYADYPFAVLVNDQFDRFSAPLERRYTRFEVETMLEQTGLIDVTVLANNGWVGEGRVPDRGLADPRLTDRRISVVVTVRNDADGLRTLIPALLAQTRAPDELVIVDGGSVDGTVEVLDEFDFGGMELRVAVRPGANIAAGRNAGIELARHDRIALTDAGCRPDPAWLAELEGGLDDADLVGGIFIADPETLFEHVLAVTHYPDPAEFDRATPGVRLAHRLFGRGYLPYRAGGRSMAFRRATWAAAGGFPEQQYAGEDAAFARAAGDLGCRMAMARGAVVRWRPPGTWRANATMFYRYCRGDIRSKGRSRHVIRAAAWTAGPALLVRGPGLRRAAVLAAGLAYVALPLQRARRDHMPLRGIAQIPLAIAVKDVAQLAGAGRGIVDAIRGVAQPTP
jgi:SAM-dependent methyltransferase/GT2 family glycosyltransferase